MERKWLAEGQTAAVQHQRGNLNENSILEYARSHNIEEATVGLSLLCSLPVDVVERALVDNNREMALILAKALGFKWETAMSLLFLGAKDYRISSRDLDGLRVAAFRPGDVHRVVAVVTQFHSGEPRRPG